MILIRYSYDAEEVKVSEYYVKTHDLELTHKAYVKYQDPFFKLSSYGLITIFVASKRKTKRRSDWEKGLGVTITYRAIRETPI